MTKHDLENLVREAIRAHGGVASVVDVCRYIWDRYRRDLEASGDLFYTWQYDARWAAHRLRRRGVIKPAEESPRGVWELA